MSARLRPARSTDAGKVGAILSEFIDTTDWMPRIHTRAEDVGFAGYMIDKGWVTVAHSDGTVSGFVARDGRDIQSLYVAAQARRSGVGSALLKRMKGEVDALSLWTFQANTGAHAFYKTHGFCEIERTDGSGNDAHLPDIRMTWKRDAP